MTDSQSTSVDSSSPSPIERAVRIGRLLDLYGSLLTERQRQFVKLHYEEDLSFGEIAKEFGISRQAVHDAVKHAETSLDEYDAKLGGTPEIARRKNRGGGAPAGEAEARTDAGPARVAGLRPCIELLAGIHERLRRSGGVIYNADGVTRDLGDALEKLRQLDTEG